MRNPAHAVEIVNVTKVYGTGEAAVRALGGISLYLEQGSFTAIMGPSGSGKSTLFNCAAGLDKPTSGQVYLGGTDITGLKEKQLTHFRRGKLGFIFQQFNLMPTLTAAKNITLPLGIAGKKLPQPALDGLLDRVGLADRANHMPNQLSGGQQQRVAIARALASHPEFIFADEPTAALDTQSSLDVLELLRDVATTEKSTIAMVTHDPVAASYADTVLFMADGNLRATLARPTYDNIAATMAGLSQPRQHNEE